MPHTMQVQVRRTYRTPRFKDRCASTSRSRLPTDRHRPRRSTSPVALPSSVSRWKRDSCTDSCTPSGAVPSVGADGAVGPEVVAPTPPPPLPLAGALGGNPELASAMARADQAGGSMGGKDQRTAARGQQHQGCCAVGVGCCGWPVLVLAAVASEEQKVSVCTFADGA